MPAFVEQAGDLGFEVDEPMAAALRRGDVREIEQFAIAMPGREIAQLVAAQDQHQRDLCTEFVAQLGERVDRVGRPVPAYLAIVDAPVRAAVDGEQQHLQALLAAGRCAVLLPRTAGRDEADFVELQRVGGGARQRQVADVHRVEGAAEQADAFQCGSVC